MNLPNKLTVSRLVLTAGFLAAIFSRAPYHESAATLLFVAASITDFFDGQIARRNKLITNFGILMDPLADKILVCSAFIAFVDRGWAPAWMAVIVVTRELAITGLRLLAAGKSVVLPAETYGKYKTILQIVAIISVLVLASYPQWGTVGKVVFGFGVFGQPWVAPFTRLALWLAVLQTLFSGAMYLWRNRKMYIHDV